MVDIGIGRKSWDARSSTVIVIHDGWAVSRGGGQAEGKKNLITDSLHELVTGNK